MKKEIKLINFIELRYADPISSMDLTNDYLLYGTMLGATKFYIINSKKLISLSEIQDEFISGVKINKNQLYICIGDLKIISYNVSTEINEEDLAAEEINNYNDDDENHNKNCDNCLTMLNNYYLIRTFIDFPAEPKDQPVTKETDISIKNIFENKEIETKINMSNYSVPFDYDGKNYIFIDFIEKKKRSFNIYDISSEQDGINSAKVEFIIEDKFKNIKFGHISHLKIIKDDTLFIVRDYNICEIRDFNLELKKALNIKAQEILAYDILFEDNDDENNENNETNENNENNENNDEDKEIAFIIILDLDANVILYNYKEDKSDKLFNLEEDNLGIDKVIKEQRFFSFGYPYYIKFTNKYIAISSDYGCILLQYS